MSGQEVRRLTPADADEVLTTMSVDGLTPERLAVELATADDYWWFGLVDSGRLCAVHRSMRWGRHLLLKGVVVVESALGSGAALRLAFALRDEARARGLDGLTAWVEPHQPEANLARMLRMRLTGPLVHRFEIPLGDLSEQEAGGNRGTVALDFGAPAAVPNLLGPAGGDGLVHWVVDGRRLVLSADPVGVAAFPLLKSAVGSLAAVRALEIPVPSADLWSALSLTRTKARRLSRTPVRIGRLDFPGTSLEQRAREAEVASC